MKGTNGKAKFLIKFLVVDIDEGFVLGRHWLNYANPDIDWPRETITWNHRVRDKVSKARGEENTLSNSPAFRFPTWYPGSVTEQLRKARKKIIASEIQANEPPTWIKGELAKVLVPRDTKTGGLPPHRGNLDYSVQLRDKLVKKNGEVEYFVPRQERRRHFSPAEVEELQKVRDLEVASGRWEVCESPQSAEMLLAAKAGGKKRPCQDYRPINRWIVGNAYPIPFTPDMLHTAARHKYLTSLDLPRAYNEVRIKDNHTKDMLAFRCLGKLYRPTVMQFGSKTAVSHYQRFIECVLGDVVGAGCLVYLDNVIVYSDTLDEHRRVTRTVLRRLLRNNLPIQPLKCEWEKPEVQFCGFLIGGGRIRLDPEKVRAVREWPEPSAESEGSLKTQVREFTGFTNFYRKSIDHYSEIAEPLTALTSKTVKWAWGPKESKAWQALKDAICKEPVLAAYDPRLPVEAHTDASDKTLGATIEHRYSCGHTQPIAFWSKKLDGAQQNYDTTNRELMAIVEAFKAHRPWMQGSPKPVVVWSDHAALQHWLDPKNTRNPRQERWATELMDYDFVVRHIAGRANRAADALSRQGTKGQQAQRSAILTKKNFEGLRHFRDWVKKSRKAG
jgi:hypothetical protein